MADLVASLALSQDDLTLKEVLQRTLDMCQEEDDGDNHLVAAGVFSQCETLLEAHRYCEGKVAQLIAELAKNEENRVPGSQSGVIPHLIHGLDDENRDTIFQNLRAIANLCFNCDISRDAVLKATGAEKLSSCLSRLLCSKPCDSELLRVLSGTTLNLATDHKEAAIALVSAGVVKRLADIVAIGDMPETVHEMALNAVQNIVESGECLSSIANVVVIQTLKVSFNRPPSLTLQQRIIELFVMIAKTDDGKRMLVEGSVCDSLLDVIMANCERRSGHEATSVTHSAADLINLVLTGDDSMALMFDEGRGRIVTDIVPWLTQSDEDLTAAGALAVGNCARNDQNCQQLFEIGIVDKLMSLIRKSSDEFVKQEAANKLQVTIAVLSTLRNFSIPASLKSQMISRGMIDIAINSIQSINPSVQFKSLAILRLLVVGQSHVACHVVETEGVVSRIVNLSGCDIHSGVKMESARLLAAIVKHCQRKDIMQNLAKCGGIDCLVRLGQSDHSIMIHEAVVALATMIISLREQAFGVWKESGLIQMALCVAQNKDLKAEIRANALNLVWHVSQLGEDAVKELRQRAVGNLVHQLTEESEELFQDVLQKLKLLNF